MKRTPYFMRGVLQGVGGFEIKNYRSFFILSPSILSAFPYHYPSYEVTYYSWGFKYHITNKGKNKPFPKVGQGLLNGRLLQSAAMDCTTNETTEEAQKRMRGLKTGGDNIRGQMFD